MSNYTEADKERKDTPVYSGFMRYFPDAMRLVAQLSLHANEKHNPGQPLHWSKGKSNDHGDCLIRHQLDIGTFDEGNDCDHAVSVAWRAMAQLQTMFEDETLSCHVSAPVGGVVLTDIRHGLGQAYNSELDR
jgi:hypothetical protein